MDVIEAGERKKDKYIIVPTDLLRSPDLTPTEKLLYLVLDTYADRGSRECFPSLETLATDLKVSRRTVVNTLEILVVKGLITKTQRKNKAGAFTSNLYRLQDLKPIDSQKQEIPSEENVKKEKSLEPMEEAQAIEITKITFEDIITQNLNLEQFKKSHKEDTNLIDSFVNIIVDISYSTQKFIRIQNQNIPTQKVIDIFKKIEQHHLEYAIRKFKQAGPIKNLRAYITSLIYDACQVAVASYENDARNLNIDIKY